MDENPSLFPTSSPKSTLRMDSVTDKMMRQQLDQEMDCQRDLLDRALSSWVVAGVGVGAWLPSAYQLGVLCCLKHKMCLGGGYKEQPPKDFPPVASFGGGSFHRGLCLFLFLFLFLFLPMHHRINFLGLVCPVHHSVNQITCHSNILKIWRQREREST
ncbi:hypothetical protein CsSME_00048591 [Camellia sinensis var. sinensis]